MDCYWEGAVPNVNPPISPTPRYAQALEPWASLRSSGEDGNRERPAEHAAARTLGMGLGFRVQGMRV